MPAYRIYKLLTQGHVTRPALVLIRENRDVIRSVESPVAGHDVEIVEGARLVARLRRRG
jgi:hypothetical protein